MKGPRSVLAALLGTLGVLAYALVGLALLAIADTGSWFDGPVDQGRVGLNAVWLLAGAGVGAYGVVRAWQGRWRRSAAPLALAAVPGLTYWPATAPLLIALAFVLAALVAFFRLGPVVLVAEDEEE